MSLNRYAKRIDDNQTAVVAALRADGFLVEIIGKPVDLLVGVAGKKWALVEVKDGGKPKSATKLTKAQPEFWNKCQGYPLFVVDSAVTAVAVMRAFGGNA